MANKTMTIWLRTRKNYDSLPNDKKKTMTTYLMTTKNNDIFSDGSKN